MRISDWSSDVCSSDLQRRRPDATVINLQSYCHIAGIDADDTGAMPNPMRVAIVSETYPPEVNGVALTVQALEHGLRTRGHAVELIRPRRRDETALASAEQLLLDRKRTRLNSSH